MELTPIRSKLAIKLALIYALNIADWGCTVVLLKTERFYEANPLAGQFITSPLMSFVMKCLFPALAVFAVIAAMRYLTGKELRIADSFICFVLVFYSVIDIDHIISFLLLFFQNSP